MIILGCDHGGFELKEYIKRYLQTLGEDIIDVGAFNIEPLDDYPIIAKKMIKVFKENVDVKIIAVCGAGTGMSICLNRQKGIRCVLGYSPEQVAKAREHNDSNALALGGRFTSKLKARKMVDCFLNTNFLGGKHARRVAMLDED